MRPDAFANGIPEVSFVAFWKLNARTMPWADERVSQQRCDTLSQKASVPNLVVQDVFAVELHTCSSGGSHTDTDWNHTDALHVRGPPM